MGNTQAQAGGARLISRSTIEVIQSRKDEIIAKWMAAQRSGLAHRQSLLSPQELLITTNEFFAVFVDALQNADLGVLADPSWAPVKEVLDRMSRARAEQGLTPSETSTMILALKETLSDILQEYFHSEPAALVGQLSGLSRLLDALALYTTEVFVKSREDVIRQQSRDLLEISCPCICLWEGILAVPIIGVLDSRRSQQVMETLLQMVVETRSKVVILDITGVPTVDTLTAAHLIKTVQAVKLLGAQALISGISGRIAQTLVGLGLDLKGVQTKAMMADGVADAFERLNLAVVRKDQTAWMGSGR